MATPIKQLLSRSIFATDGTTTVWDFSFSGGYLDRTHIKAFVRTPEGGQTDLVLNYDTQLIGPYQLLISPALAEGDELHIRRDTPKNLPLVDFTDGAVNSEIALDTNAKQAVFIAAESADEVAVIDVARLSELVDVAGQSASASAASASEASAYAASASESLSTATVILGSAASIEAAAVSCQTSANSSIAASSISQAARDAALSAAGPIYATDAAGRAASADGAYYRVMTVGSLATQIYQRVSAGVSNLIVSMPTSDGLTARNVQEPCQIIPSSGTRLLPDFLAATAAPLPNRLRIHADTLLQRGDTRYTIAAQTDIDLDAVASSVKRVFYDTVGSTFVVIAFNTALTLTQQKTLWLVATVRLISGTVEASMACPYTIMGSAVKTITEHCLISAPNINIGATPLGNRPNLDTATNVLSFPADSILHHGEDDYIVPGGGLSITLNFSGSTVAQVFWRKSTNTIEQRDWSAVVTQFDEHDLVMICTVRNQTGGTRTVTSLSPITVDFLMDGYFPIRFSLAFNSQLCEIIPSAVTAPHLPTFTADGKLQIQGDTILVRSNQRHVITATTLIDLTSVASSAKLVFYDTTSTDPVLANRFFVRNWNDTLTAEQNRNWMLVCRMRIVIAGGITSQVWASINCPYRFVSAEAPTWNDWAGLIAPSAAVPNIKRYISYSTTSRNLVIPADTLVLHGSNRFVVASETTVAIPSATTAHVVYFRKSNNTFSALSWTAVPSDADKHDLVRVLEIRHHAVGGGATLRGPSLWLCDGRIFDLYQTKAKMPAEAKVQAIAHRGASGTSLGPENTLPAYTLARDLGFAWVEADLRLTSDGVWVLLHNSTIDATSNGTGAIDSMTLATAKTYDFGSWKSAAYTGTTIPTLEELLQHCCRNDLRFYAELKTDATQPQIDSLVALIRKYGMQKRCVLNSFHQPALTKLNTTAPEIARGLLATITSDANCTALVATCVANGWELHPADGTLTDTRAAEIKAAGLRLVVWTINDAIYAKVAANRGVDGIMTDALHIESEIADVQA